MRAIVDRALTGLALLALRGFFRDLEVRGTERVPRDRPLLVVANHFNALVDAVLLIAVLGRLPRFVAKAALWRRAVARPFLWLAGLVPVERPSDVRDGTSGGPLSEAHRATFATCTDVLARGATVAIFPEGAVSRLPQLAPVRTGTARIALGTLASGVDDLVVVPVGLAYEDKVALRSRALAEVGEVLHVGAWAREQGIAVEPGDRRAVRALTDAVAERLAAVSPDYADDREQLVLGRAAEVALREPGRVRPSPVPLSAREQLARRLARAPRAAKERLVDALGRYQLDLSVLGVRDEAVVADTRAQRLLGLLAAAALRFALIAPFALVGALVNALPYWGVHWMGRLVRNPMLKGSARLLAGVALFPTAWAVTAWLSPAEGWIGVTAAIVSAPVLGLIAVRALEDAVVVRRAWRAWVMAAERGPMLPSIRSDRERVVALVEETAAVAPDRPTLVAERAEPA